MTRRYAGGWSTYRTSSRKGLPKRIATTPTFLVASLRCGVSLFEFRLLSRSSAATSSSSFYSPSSRRLVVLGAPHALLRRMECSGCAVAAVAAGVDLSRSSSRARRIMKHAPHTQHRDAHVHTHTLKINTRAMRAYVSSSSLFFSFLTMPRRSYSIREVTRLYLPC